MTPGQETHQILRDLYPTPEDAQFYGRALEILSRPRRMLRTIGLVANILVYSVWLCTTAFLLEQAGDRAQPPYDLRTAIARPAAVHAGEPVHVVVDLVRHRRCTYTTTWTVTDAEHMVVSYGPVVQRAPGTPGPDTYTWAYETPAAMVPGPATLRISARAECDDNYLDDWWPRTIDVPPVAFDVLPPPSPLHDAAPPPRFAP